MVGETSKDMETLHQTDTNSTHTWQVYFSKTQQRPYFFNQVTNETRWISPTSVSDVILDPQGLLSKNTSQSKRPNSSEESVGNTSIRDEKEGSAIKRPRRSDESVITDAYMPPDAGNTADVSLEARIQTRSLPASVQITVKLACSVVEMWTNQAIQVNPVLAETYRNGYIVDIKGEKKKFKDVTNPLQGRHIYNLVKDNGFLRTLEVGFAMGASAVWVTQAFKDRGVQGLHYALDPNQTTQYEDIGEYLVKKCGLSKYMQVIRQTSYRALPALYESVLLGTIPKFDMIYIDGWHTFDYTLLDFFYADLLLNVNGVIVLDDIRHIPVKACMEYIVANFKHYELVHETPVFNIKNMKESSQATFIKRGNDVRTWNAHQVFEGSMGGATFKR